jgi:hypothetical protein
MGAPILAAMESALLAVGVDSTNATESEVLVANAWCTSIESMIALMRPGQPMPAPDAPGSAPDRHRSAVAYIEEAHRSVSEAVATARSVRDVLGARHAELLTMSKDMAG